MDYATHLRREERDPRRESRPFSIVLFKSAIFARILA